MLWVIYLVVLNHKVGLATTMFLCLQNTLISEVKGAVMVFFRYAYILYAKLIILFFLIYLSMTDFRYYLHNSFQSYATTLQIHATLTLVYADGLLFV